jgi:hypothetical protein
MLPLISKTSSPSITTLTGLGFVFLRTRAIFIDAPFSLPEVLDFFEVWQNSKGCPACPQDLNNGGFGVMLRDGSPSRGAVKAKKSRQVQLETGLLCDQPVFARGIYAPED